MGVRPRCVQRGTAVTVNCAHMQRGQRRSPLFVARGFVEIVIEQTTPTAFDTDDLNAGVGTAIHDGFDGGVQSRDVTATGQNSYTHNIPP